MTAYPAEPVSLQFPFLHDTHRKESVETTLSSKGQLTLPKSIRDRLGLVAGARLDIDLQADGTMRVRVVSTDPLAISAVLPPPSRRNVPEAEIRAAIRQRAQARFTRSK